ncbi:MAG: immunoglobulin domain-containing protein [Anaerovoracaceae bacterium]
MTKRILSMLLSVILILTMVPAMALADTSTAVINASIDNATGNIKWDPVMIGETPDIAKDNYTIEAQQYERTGNADKNIGGVIGISFEYNSTSKKFEANFLTSNYTEDETFKITIKRTVNGALTNQKVLETTGKKEVVIDKKLAAPTVSLSSYTDNEGTSKNVNGLKVTISPTITGEKKAKSYEVNLYRQKMDYAETVSGVPSSSKHVRRIDVTAPTNQTDNVYANFSESDFVKTKEENNYLITVVARGATGYTDSEVVYKTKKKVDPLKTDGDADFKISKVEFYDTYNRKGKATIASNKVSLFKGYFEVLSTTGKVIAKTPVQYNKTDKSGTTSVSVDLSNYVFVEDYFNLKYTCEIDGNKYLEEVTAVAQRVKPTRGPSQYASIYATMNNLGGITFDKTRTIADEYYYTVNYKGKSKFTSSKRSIPSDGTLPREIWGKGIPGVPDAEQYNLKDFSVTLHGSKTNYLDSTVTLQSDGTSSTDSYISGNIDILLAIAKPYNTAAVNLAGIRPTGAAGNLNYSWYIAGNLVSTSQTYQIQPSDIGKTLSVTVSAFSGYRGSLSTSVFLDGGKPVINTQPVSAKYIIGDKATPLTVGATTTGSTLRYQWYKDGVAIAGATSASYTPSTKDRAKDEYYCVITNNDGTVTSSVATVQNLIKVGDFTMKAKKYRTTIKLMWYKAENADKYRVYERINGKYKAIKTVKNRSLWVKVKPGSKHVYKIKAINGGCYSWSPAKKFTAYK